MKQFENFLESEVWDEMTDDMWLALVNTPDVYDSFDALMGEVATSIATVYDMVKDFDWIGVPLSAKQIEAVMQISSDPNEQAKIL